MKKSLIILGWLSFLWLISPARAQVSNQTLIPGNPPGGIAGACLISSFGYLVPVTQGSEIVLCDPMTHLWTVTSGGGAGTCGALAGDVTGTCAANTVVKINGTLLSGLNTGILKNTIATGVPTIAIAGTDYAAANATTAVNGQTCALGSTCNVNAGAAANTLGINAGNGAALTGLLLNAHQVAVGVAGIPTAKTITDCTDTAGQHINYTQSTDTWSCGTSNGTSTTANWVGFTNQTSVTNTHNLGTNDVFVNCFDGSNVVPGFTATNTSVNVTVFTFTNAQTGRCGVTTGGNGTGGGGGGGSVNSVTASAPVASSGGANPNITIVNFTGDSGAGGANGAVPAPAAGDNAAGKVLGASGAWILPGSSTILIVKGNGNHAGAGSIAGEFFSSCDTSGGAFSLTLPASPSTGEVHKVKKIDTSANACTVSGNGKTIDGQSTIDIVTTMGGLEFYYTGTVWYISGVL